MRKNKFGIRGLQRSQRKDGPVYFWIPPVSLQKAGIFKHKTLGGQFDKAKKEARMWNQRLAEYRLRNNAPRPVLAHIKLGTVGDLVRQFERSPKFARYALRTQQDYSWMFRSIECQSVHGNRMFGHLNLSEVTRQLAYTLYEENVSLRGSASANKAMNGWSSAFRYGMLKFEQLTSNPFADLDMLYSPPRRQRWTDDQLSRFIKAADRLGDPSIGRCALMCMKLVQRPRDILSLKWGAYDRHERVWHIGQTKRGAVVRVPETRRLRLALGPIRRSVPVSKGAEANERYVCGTVTGKRWHRRNFTKAVRSIARVIGLPDELQIRDLRRTAATEGASAGATPAEMMAVGGWSSPTSIRPYLVQTREQASSFQEKRDKYRRLRCSRKN